MDRYTGTSRNGKLVVEISIHTPGFHNSLAVGEIVKTLRTYYGLDAEFNVQPPAPLCDRCEEELRANHDYHAQPWGEISPELDKTLPGYAERQGKLPVAPYQPTTYVDLSGLDEGQRRRELLRELAAMLDADDSLLPFLLAEKRKHSLELGVVPVSVIEGQRNFLDNESLAAWERWVAGLQQQLDEIAPEGDGYGQLSTPPDA